MAVTRSAGLVASLACVVALACAPAAGAATPAPFWMKSKQIRERIDAAGKKGVTYTQIRKWVRMGLAGKSNADEPVVEPCPTGPEPDTKPNSVHTNACITYPAGCTANFIYQQGDQPFTGVSDGRNHFIGTAGHCVDHAGQPVYMDNGSGGMIRAGEVWKKMNGGPGNDFAAIRITKGHSIDPGMPAIGGPKGIYTGCTGGQTISWWGHGYFATVGPGNKGTGLVTYWWDRAFGWNGDGLPGDSGSGVVIDGSKMAAGNLTHLVIDSRYPATSEVGTRLTHALAWMGGNIHLVNEDGTLADAPRNTGCGNPNNGGG